MSDVWRICVVVGEQALNQNLVNSLRKDGYIVNGTRGNADAMRMLWLEEYDVVICDLELPSGGGFELLRWLRAYRSNVRVIVVGEASRTGDVDLRLLALEGGATSYLEKPVDVRQIKDELRSLLQQTGFSASLDSFDLLDVIQIINMTRKSITLLVNTGLEEHGLLRFQNGDLAWAEYGILRGEEAFFALAAHKNGRVAQQITNEPSETNVSRPLSRLIFQALQYRAKYADKPQCSGEQLPVTSTSVIQPQVRATESVSDGPYPDPDLDDMPFIFSDSRIVSNPGMQMASSENMLPMFPVLQEETSGQFEPVASSKGPEREDVWCEETGKTLGVGRKESQQLEHPIDVSTSVLDVNSLRQALSCSQPVPVQESYAEPEQSVGQLPSWLIEQPTIMQVAYHSPQEFSVLEQVSSASHSQSISGGMQQIRSTPAESGPLKTTDDLLKRAGSSSRLQAFAPEVEDRRASSAKWSLPAVQQKPLMSQSPRSIRPSGIFEPVFARSSQQETSASGAAELQAGPQSAESDNLARGEREGNGTPSGSLSNDQRQVVRKNALISALQTLGYSIPGFIAAAVLDIESSPLAQVAIDDADYSQTWRLLGVMQRNMLDALLAGEWGNYEETMVTISSRYLLMRSVGVDKNALLVLITTRDASYADSLEVMANVEGAICAALR